MRNTETFLLKFRNDVFKLLPMRESLDEGKDNHLGDYLYSLIIAAEGAVNTYPELENQKSYIYVVTNLNYLYSHLDVEFQNWRKTILNSTRNLDDLRVKSSNGGLTQNE